LSAKPIPGTLLGLELTVKTSFFLIFVSILSLALGALAAPAVQLAAPNEAGVAMGQFHYVVSDVEANQKFWVLLGATPVRMSGTEAVVKFRKRPVMVVWTWV
jgi:hypothetical protein